MVDISVRIQTVEVTNAKHLSRETEGKTMSQQTAINHGSYQIKTRGMSHASLRYTIKDAREAINAMPEGHKVGYYEDEIHYCAMEIARRIREAK